MSIVCYEIKKTCLSKPQDQSKYYIKQLRWIKSVECAIPIAQTVISSAVIPSAVHA